MTLAEYIRGGYPVDVFASAVEERLLSFPDDTRIACRDREELNQMLDIVQKFFHTLHIGFDRDMFSGSGYSHWFYFYKSCGAIHIGGGNCYETIPLSDIIDEITDGYVDDFDVFDIGDLDALFI